jgi:Ner family transcriptional regulator
MPNQQPTPTTFGTPIASGGWHPEQIKAAIRMRGKRLRELALENGYSQDVVYMVLRKRHWPDVEIIVSEFLGVPLHELWPGRYTPDNRPRPECRSRLHTGDQ